MNPASDRFEAETAELPVLSDEEIELAQLRRTPPRGTTVVGAVAAVGQAPCTDPAYVVYLERQLMAAQVEAESARSVFHAVGEHNAALTDEVAVLRVKLQDALELVVNLQSELLTKK